MVVNFLLCKFHYFLHWILKNEDKKFMATRRCSLGIEFFSLLEMLIKSQHSWGKFEAKALNQMREMLEYFIIIIIFFFCSYQNNKLIIRDQQNIYLH